MIDRRSFLQRTGFLAGLTSFPLSIAGGGKVIDSQIGLEDFFGRDCQIYLWEPLVIEDPDLDDKGKKPCCVVDTGDEWIETKPVRTTLCIPRS